MLPKFHFLTAKKIDNSSGADLGLVDQTDFPSTLKHYKKPILTTNFVPGMEKHDKKAVYRHFFENYDEKIAFFRRALPFKSSIDWLSKNKKVR